MVSTPVRAGESAAVLLLSFAAFASVTNSLQLSPLLTALAEEFGKSESTVGQVASISSFIGTAVALGVAPLMHRWPMVTWLRAQSLILLLAVVTMSTAQSFEMLVVSRVISGIGGGAFLATCFTAANEYVTNPARTGRAVAIVATGTTMASLAGIPILALIREAAGWRWASAFVAVPLVIVLIGSLWLPRIAPASDHATTGAKAMADVLRHRPTSWILLAVILLFVTYFGWVVYFAAYVEIEFNGSAALVSAIFLVAGLAELSGNATAPGLLRRFAGFALTIAGCLGAAFALLGSGVIFTTVALLFVSVALLNVCVSFIYVGSYTLLLGSMPGQKATMMALASAATGFGAAIGSLLGGALLAGFDDYNTMFQVLGLVMVVAAGAVVASKRSTVGVS